jgi:hypothetical protein
VTRSTLCAATEPEWSTPPEGAIIDVDCGQQIT